MDNSFKSITIYLAPTMCRTHNKKQYLGFETVVSKCGYTSVSPRELDFQVLLQTYKKGNFREWGPEMFWGFVFVFICLVILMATQAQIPPCW